jgi:hypothetical protein
MGRPIAALATVMWVASVFWAGVFSQSVTTAPDMNTIMERSIATNEADWRDEPTYNHRERDDSGHGSKTYEVIMIDGTPYERLVAVNDQELPPAKERDEQEKLDRVIAKRRSESASERAHRLAEYTRQHERIGELFRELSRAFNFRLEGERQTKSGAVYVVAATPRTDYTPPDMDARALTGMNAEFLIDAHTFHWVKVSAQVRRPVSLFGVLMRLEPGTSLELEKTPVGDGVWQISRLAIRSHAKVLAFLPHRTYEDDRFDNYAKASQ